VVSLAEPQPKWKLVNFSLKIRQSGGKKFNCFAENKLIKSTARDAGAKEAAHMLLSGRISIPQNITFSTA